jgi:hypothetical protein
VTSRVQFCVRAFGAALVIAALSADASDDERLAYRIAVADMLKRCAPLPFTEGLGNAVAGRPFTMRLIDERKLKQAENYLWPTRTTR